MVVVGIGVSNMPLIRYLLGKGAQVIACDRKTEAELAERATDLGGLGVSLCTGPQYLAPLADHDLIFLTPGIPKHLPPIVAARERGAHIAGEIGVVMGACKAPVIGITGSAGKTTTTTLIGEILRAALARPVFVGGNIGQPLIEQVEEIPEEAAVVLELSSFQLQLTGGHSPQIALITNISPNHLDIHASMAEYVEAKRNIIRFQRATDTAILNYDDDLVRSFADGAPGRVVFFSRAGDPGTDTCAFIREEQLIWRYRHQEFATLRVDEIQLLGVHNQENVLAAMAAGYLAGAGMHAIRAVLSSFAGVEHRLEPVRTLDGAHWYNDSKATSPAEAVAALQTLGAPIVLIAGGSDKGIPFDPMAPLIAQKVKALIVTGPTAQKIVQAAREAGFAGPVHHAADLAEAVTLARRGAAPGDHVLLSPGCASFDAYRNFEERGRHFKELVAQLRPLL